MSTPGVAPTVLPLPEPRPPVTAKIRCVFPPEMISPGAALPSIVSDVARITSPVGPNGAGGGLAAVVFESVRLSVIVCPARLGSKTIVSPEAALARTTRSVPGVAPSSGVARVTVSVFACAGLPPSASRHEATTAKTNARTFTIPPLSPTTNRNGRGTFA